MIVSAMYRAIKQRFRKEYFSHTSKMLDKLGVFG